MPFVDQIINWLKNQDGNITDLEEVGNIYLLFLSHSNDTFKTFKRWFFFGFFAYRFNRLLFTVHFFYLSIISMRKHFPTCNVHVRVSPKENAREV